MKPYPTRQVGGLKGCVCVSTACKPPLYPHFIGLAEILKFPVIEQGIPLCIDHNESAFNPHVLSTWVPEKIGGPTTKRLIYLESQVPISGVCILSRPSLSVPRILRSAFSGAPRSDQAARLEHLLALPQQPLSRLPIVPADQADRNYHPVHSE